MKRLFVLLLLICSFSLHSKAQITRYIVRFKDKGGSSFTLANPLAYLSQRAVDRRTSYSIPIDSTDLPVIASYISQVSSITGVTLLNISKWLNAVSIQTTDPNAITAINNLSFVNSVTGLAARVNSRETPAITKNKFEWEEKTAPAPVVQKGSGILTDYFDYGSNSFNEIHLHNGEFLHNIGLRGQGMQLALLDGGFMNYTTLKAFDSVNANGQILGTWDFVNREASVVEDHPHGMQCLSTIAANIPGQFIGKAPKASFYLFRTEDTNSEYPIEEFNWVCGAERADSSGSNVLSTSLGYFDFDDASFNYVYENMDGNTTLSAIGADLAAKKGMLVFAAAGNEGNGPWHYLTTPSDADSVIAVAAVSTSGAVGGFSSYGPSADGQIKPDIASIGVSALIQNTSNTISMGNGTSFACPNMAGLGTCLWQGFPEFNNMKIVRTLQQAGNKFSMPDDRVGYGIPDMKLAFGMLLTEFATSSSAVDACNAKVNWTSKDVAAMKYEIERMTPGETSFTKVGELEPLPGNLLAIHSYQFANTLINVNQGAIQYRVRQIIDTSSAGFAAVYIDTTTISISAGCFATGTGGTSPVKEFVTIRPNPVADPVVTLLVETPYAIQSMTINMYDSKGRLISQTFSSKSTGKKEIELSLDKLAKGKYYIKVFNGEQPVGTAAMIRL